MIFHEAVRAIIELIVHSLIMGVNDSVKSYPRIWLMPLGQRRDWNFHMYLPSGFIFCDMAYHNNFWSEGTSSIGRGIYKYFSDSYYNIEKRGHLSSGGGVGIWGTFWCKRVLMVYL